MINIFDVIIILFLLLFCVLGFKRGVIREAVSLVGIIIVLILSFYFKDIVGNFLCKYFPFFNFSGEFEGLVTLNILIYQLAGFLVAFSILIGLYNIIMFATKIVQKLVNISIIFTIPSMLGGAVIGLIRGYIIVLLLLLALMLPLKNVDIYNESKLKDFILFKTPGISFDLSKYSLQIMDSIDLGKQIHDGKIDVNEANQELLDNMLKLKIVDKHTIEQLVVLDKLKNVKNIDNILNKY